MLPLGDENCLKGNFMKGKSFFSTLMFLNIQLEDPSGKFLSSHLKHEQWKWHKYIIIFGMIQK